MIPLSQKPFMYNRNNPFHYYDPSGYVSYIGVNTTDAGSGMGHEMVIVQDSTDPSKGTMYSWRPDTAVQSLQNLAGHPGVVDISHGSIADLMKGSKGYDWHRVGASTSQDKAIAITFMSANRIEHFNLATNNCSTMTERAYLNAGHPVGLPSLTPDPKATEFWLNTTGYPGGAQP